MGRLGYLCCGLVWRSTEQRTRTQACPSLPSPQAALSMTTHVLHRASDTSLAKAGRGLAQSLLQPVADALNSDDALVQALRAAMDYWRPLPASAQHLHAAPVV